MSGLAKAMIVTGLVAAAIAATWVVVWGVDGERPTDLPFGFSDDSFEQGDVPTNVSGTLAAAAGATAQRFSVSWATVQCCSPSEFDWSTYDAVVAGMREHGLEPLPVLVGSPGWARDPGCLSALCPPSEEHLGDFARFAAAAVSRWHQPDVGMPLLAVQIWNEPNSSGFWPTATGPDAGAYAKLFAAAGSTIDRVDDGLPLVVAGLDGSSAASRPPGYVSIPNFLGEFFDHLPPGALDDQDMLAAHAYAARFDEIMAETRSIRDSYAPGRRILVTETGASSDVPDIDELRQANEITAVLDDLEASDDIAGIFIYTLVEPAAATGTPGGLGVVGSARGYEPKLAYCAIAEGMSMPRPVGCVGG